MKESEYIKLTYRQTEGYHDQLRAELYETVEEQYKHLGVNLREITFQDVNVAESWKKEYKNPKHAPQWDWVEMYHNYHSRGAARRLDLAIYKGNFLTGLAYGMLDRNRLILKVHALAANPQNDMIRGNMVNIVLFAANVYALVNNVPEIWLCTPVTQAHVKLYSKRGYEPYYNSLDKCTHLIKRLK
ncbi:MAG: hypothetical protein ACI93R_001058 [Flavobacteriales bacterium]|jgi:hypothetical protein